MRILGEILRKYKYYKIKIITNRSISGKIFKFLIFVSIIFSFISSEDELIPLFTTPILKKVFINDLTGNSIIFNLSLGYLVSCIFYFIVVYLPEIRKKELLKPYTSVRVSFVIGRIERMIQDIIDFSKEDVKINKITTLELNKICSLVDPREKEKGSNRPLWELLTSQWDSIERAINQIERNNIHLDIDLIAIFNYLSDSEVKIGMDGLKKIENSRYQNIELWDECFGELLKVGYKLTEYYNNHEDKKFKDIFPNDFS